MGNDADTNVVAGIDPVERMIAESDIRAMLYRYARAADRNDPELLRSVYHPGAIDNHGFYNGDVEGFIEYFKTRHANVVQSSHFLANILIEFLSPVVAVTETYCLCYRRLRESDLPPGKVRAYRFIARVCDRFEKRQGQWRIAERQLVYETSDSEVVDENSGFMPPVVVQAHGLDDPSYAFRASALKRAEELEY